MTVYTLAATWKGHQNFPVAILLEADAWTSRRGRFWGGNACRSYLMNICQRQWWLKTSHLLRYITVAINIEHKCKLQLVERLNPSLFSKQTHKFLHTSLILCKNQIHFHRDMHVEDNLGWQGPKHLIWSMRHVHRVINVSIMVDNIHRNYLSFQNF